MFTAQDDPSSLSKPISFYDDEDDNPTRQLARLVSPAPAESLVPPMPRPNQPTSAGVVTVNRDLNGNPAGSPASTLSGPSRMVRPASAGRIQQTVADSSQYNGVSNPPDGGAVRTISQDPQPAVRPGVLASQSFNAAPNSSLQPAASPNALQPAMPLDRLPRQQAFRTQAYNASSAPAQYAARVTPVSTDPLNPDPNASLRPGGSNPQAQPGAMASVLPAVPQANVTGAVRPVSQLQPASSAGGFLHGLGRVADVAGSILAPGATEMIPGSTMYKQRQAGIQQARAKSAADIADVQSQAAERTAQGQRATAQANYYNPEPLSSGQAQSLGHPEWEGLKLDARDAERLVGGAAHNQTTLQTHFGGQQRKISADDAAAIGTPSLEGASMSNDEYQRLLQGTQHNQQWNANNQRTTGQSDVNNQRNNSTRITTTGMRDNVSAANSQRAHPGGGASKPIPAGVRDRIESQKQTALSKARASFDSGESSMDDYLNNWQQAQDDYEGRIEAQTSQPVQHLDVRSNVDSQGNWRGGSAPRPAGAQPEPGRHPSFVTQKGSHVAIGDPVKVGGRSGRVTGFNARTGKAQVQWDSGN
jgi:hypothetical protein